MELTKEQESALRGLDKAATDLKKNVGGKAGEGHRSTIQRSIRQVLQAWTKAMEVQVVN